MSAFVVEYLLFCCNLEFRIYVIYIIIKKVLFDIE